MNDQQIFEANAKIFELEKQRNQALTDCINKAVQLALAGQKIGELEKQVQDMTPKKSEA